MSFSLQIGLTMRVVEAQGYAETRDALSQDWPGFMRSVLPEALWMPLPNLGKDIVEYVQSWELNGFIITGGNNISEYQKRDETELALIKYALDNKYPIFGVCRGLQIMAHYFEYEISPCTGHAGTRHEISLSGNKRTVNSYHDNCGPLEVNPPLIPLARDNQGHIEGFHHQEKPLMAVMWHPEREIPVLNFDIKMTRKFFGLPL